MAQDALRPVDGPIPKSEPSQLVQSLARGIDIFEFVLEAGEPVRILDVAAQFGIDKSGAYRFLTTLERRGLLSKDPRTKTYLIGPRLRDWSEKLRDTRSELLASVRPLVEQLAAETKATAHLAVLQANRVVLIEVSSANTVIAIRQNVGDWEPLYCSAVGKAIVAFLPDAARKRVVERINFERHTPQTITSVFDLEIEFSQIRSSGIAFDRGEQNPDICCIACPILNAAGTPVASIGISMARRLIDGGPDTQMEAIRRVQAIAARAQRQQANAAA
jgi:IclR family acetate operon transcriptional repressor